MLSADHEDSKYVAVLYNYEKEIAVKYREYSTFLYTDDKANVPIGMSCYLSLFHILTSPFPLVYTHASQKITECLCVFLVQVNHFILSQLVYMVIIKPEFLLLLHPTSVHLIMTIILPVLRLQ